LAVTRSKLARGPRILEEYIIAKQVTLRSEEFGKADPCADELLVQINLRDRSVTVPIKAYIRKSVAHDFDKGLQEINAVEQGGIRSIEVFRTYEYQVSA
jgi:hypothetical protein